jgi:hypothetical protein
VISVRIIIIELDSLQFKRESVNNCDEFDAITKKASRGRRREFEAGTRPAKKKKTKRVQGFPVNILTRSSDFDEVNS